MHEYSYFIVNNGIRDYCNAYIRQYFLVCYDVRVRDILIIASFIAARLSQSVQVFFTRFLHETLVLISLNIAFVIVFVLILYHIKKQKKSFINRQEKTHGFCEYFVGLQRVRVSDMLWGLCVGALLVGIGGVFSLLKSPVPAVISASSFSFAVVLIVSAAFVEEVFYRSYIIALLQRMELHSIFVVVFSAFLFAIGHVSDVITSVLFAFSAGIILSLFMLFRNSLWANTLAHVAYNMLLYTIAR